VYTATVSFGNAPRARISKALELRGQDWGVCILPAVEPELRQREVSDGSAGRTMMPSSFIAVV
jgi:hypothetical protein